MHDHLPADQQHDLRGLGSMPDAPDSNQERRALATNSETTTRQLIVVAVLVCLFAAGMAGLLNFFKYRSHAENLLNERLVVSGQSIEASIRASLALGLQFSDIGTLPERMERELKTDELTRSIEIFDVDGNVMYSTDRLRAARGIHKRWLEEAREADGGVWNVRDRHNSAVGIAIKNSFGLVIGYLALRYIEDDVNKNVQQVAKQIFLSSLLTFIVTAVLSSLALVAVMMGINRDMRAMEAMIDEGGTAGVIKGPFAVPLERFFATTRKAESNLKLLRKQLKTPDA
jgi:hypothetical protein